MLTFCELKSLLAARSVRKYSYVLDCQRDISHRLISFKAPLYNSGGIAYFNQAAASLRKARR